MVNDQRIDDLEKVLQLEQARTKNQEKEFEMKYKQLQD